MEKQTTISKRPLEEEEAEMLEEVQTSATASKKRRTEQRKVFSWMEETPYDIVARIALGLDYRDILALCATSKTMQRLCRSDETFWKAKAQQLGISPELTQNGWTGIPPRERYIQLLSLTDCVPGSEKYLTADVCIQRAARANRFKFVQYLYSKVPSAQRRKALVAAAEGAAAGGNLPIIQWTIDQGISNIALGAAAQVGSASGHFEVPLYLAEQGKTKIPSRMLKDAARYNNRGIVNDIWSHPATPAARRSMLFEILEGASTGGHTDLMDWVFKQRLDIPGSDFKYLLSLAAENNQMASITKLLERRAAPFTAAQIDAILFGAIRGGSIPIIDYLLNQRMVDLVQVLDRATVQTSLLILGETAPALSVVRWYAPKLLHLPKEEMEQLLAKKNPDSVNLLFNALLRDVPALKTLLSSHISPLPWWLHS